MSLSTLLLEDDTAVLDEVSYKQVLAMDELMRQDGEGCFHLSRSPRGMTLSVDGYVGQVNFRNGSSLNLLPLIPNLKDLDGSNILLMEMLYSVFGMETRREDYQNLFEFCVRVFVDDVSRLLNKGLRSKYHSVEGNEKAFKGRIMFNEHIRQNFIHKERIYVEYETYSQDRPENRIIKATLEALTRRSTDNRNKKNLKSLTLEMEEIPASEDVDRDFSRCIMDRNMTDYQGPMMWCNIFLKGMDLGANSGGIMPYALLVKTDVLFAAYVARKSSASRLDGSFLIKYKADVKTEGGSSGVSVITIDLDWNFYNREKDITVRDAEMMFMSAPGYRVIPRPYRGDRLRSMAGSYLADAMV